MSKKDPRPFESSRFKSVQAKLKFCLESYFDFNLKLNTQNKFIDKHVKSNQTSIILKPTQLF